MTVLSAGIINADVTTLIDNFDDGLSSGWTGETTAFSADTTTVYEGAGSVVTDSANDLLDIRSTPGDGLASYFPHGERMRVFSRAGASSTTNDYHHIYFGYADSNNWWRAEIQYNTGDIELILNDAGTSSQEATTAVTIPTQTWVEAIITRDDGSYGGANYDLTFELRDTSDDSLLASISTNNSAHETNDGLGHRMNQVDGVINADWQHLVPPQ